MAHKNVTQSRLIPMPRQTGLLCRKGRFYINIRVPKELRPLYGKTEIIRKALGTSDYREAVREARYRAFEAETDFEAKRKNLCARTTAAEREILHQLSDREAHDLVFRFLIDLEKTTEEWWQQDGSQFDESDRDESLDTLRTDEVVYSGGSKHYAPEDGSAELDSFLKSAGLECPKGSPSYQKLRPLFRLARLENIKRTIDRLNMKGVQVHQPIFQNVFAHTSLAKKKITLAELVESHQQALREAKNTEGTLKTYLVPARLLCEVLGENTVLDEISTEDADRLLKLLRRAPANATKIYRGMTLEQAIAAADRKNKQGRLSPKTLENYFNNISSIFNFAVQRKMLSENPFRDRWLRAAFKEDEGAGDKVHFSTDELNQLFNAPLYKGCVDDCMGFAKEGSNHPRRGRFWVPLLSLFHGLRCNEAAQLYTEDIGEIEGIPYFEIRATREDGSKCDKHLKTKQSKRRVPIHPELLKMGFLDFVRTRRKDKTFHRLFPELPNSPTGYFSNPFSKWFGRFKTIALGTDCKATFHSFRHHFCTALNVARVSPKEIDMLGGWQVGRQSSAKIYDRPSMERLFSCIEQVQYPGLDLSHLYAPADCGG